MKIVRGSKNITGPLSHPAVAIGNFDGVHLGHQSVVRKAVEQARRNNGVSAVLTFEPHPLKILAPEKVPPLLTTFRKKMELMEQCGIDMVICEAFDRRFADQEPEQFVEEVLVKAIGVKEVTVGFDYAFGKGRQGTIPRLREMGGKWDFAVHVVGPVTVDGRPVSSSRIREALDAGDVESAARRLGRPYSLEGAVVKGFRAGGGIGFPTANIDPGEALVPGGGVYAVYVAHKNRRYPGVANIGFNPTFHRKRLSVEAHILDFDEQIYGQEIEAFFIKRIRGEIEFKSADELAEQIRKDAAEAKTLLAERPF